MSNQVTSSSTTAELNRGNKPTAEKSPWAILFKFETIIVACLMLTAFLPMGYIHFWQLLKKTHYQFVVYLPFLLVLLFFRETNQETRSRVQPGSALILITLLFVTSMLTLISIWKWSPWLNYATSLLAAGAYAYWLQGLPGVQRVLPYLIMSACALPLPFALDEYITTLLKNIATDWCSITLDQFGIQNLTYKNVIEISGKELFVADACSGIHSLFVMTTGAIFISLWNNRGPLQTVSLIITTFGLVMIENVARLVIVSYAWTIGNDLTVGNPHKILGFILFGVSLFFLWSFDNLLNFIFGNANTTSRNYTSVIDGNYSRTTPQNPRAMSPWSGMIICSLIFPVLATMQLNNASSQISNLPPIVVPEYPIPEFKPEVMPETLKGLKFMGQRQIKRVAEDPMGKSSQAWEYRKDGLFVRISLDYPYDLPHDMCLCYYNTGWTINERNIVKINSDSSFSDATMSRPMFGNGYVAFVQFNHEGKYEFEQKSDSRIGIEDTAAIKKNFWQSLTNLFGRGASNNPDKSVSVKHGPWYQVQLIAISHEPITPTLQEDLRNMFRETQGILVKECLKHLPHKVDN